MSNFRAELPLYTPQREFVPQYVWQCFPPEQRGMVRRYKSLGNDYYVIYNVPNPSTKELLQLLKKQKFRYKITVAANSILVEGQ